MNMAKTTAGNSRISSANGTSHVSRLLVMIGKEMLEQARSFKLIWVPLVFIVLGIMQPVVYYYMPVILKSAGNMPDGTVIEMPLPSGSQVMAETLGQYGVLGILVLVLVFMGVVSNERNNGSAAMILVKPISVAAYVVSKWIAMLVLSAGSLILGYLSSWYYTNLLIGEVGFMPVITSMFMYLLWLMLVLTITLFFSVLLRSSAAAAFSALGSAVLLTVLTGFFPKQLGWGPGALSGLAAALATDSVADYGRVYGVAALSAALICGLLALAVVLLRRSPAID